MKQPLWCCMLSSPKLSKWPCAISRVIEVRLRWRAKPPRQSFSSLGAYYMSEELRNRVETGHKSPMYTFMRIGGEWRHDPPRVVAQLMYVCMYLHITSLFYCYSIRFDCRSKQCRRINMKTIFSIQFGYRLTTLVVHNTLPLFIHAPLSRMYCAFGLYAFACIWRIALRVYGAHNDRVLPTFWAAYAI